jgi:hypothetical protein
MSASPDFSQLARDLGLTQALYPAVQAFRLIGCGKSYGWEKLVRSGELPVVRYPGGKLTMVKAVDIAAFIYRREQSAPTPRVVGSRRRRKGVNATLQLTGEL